MIKITHTQFKDPTLIQDKDKDKGEVNVSNAGRLFPVCYRCTQVPKGGLYDGFRVQGMFFCSNCQQELLKADQGSPEYQEFIFLIKGIFY